jgi:hypothetical protein
MIRAFQATEKLLTHIVLYQGVSLLTPQTAQSECRVVQAAEKLAWHGVLYQGVSLLTPQTAQNECRVLQAAETLTWQGVLYQGASLLTPQAQQNDFGLQPPRDGLFQTDPLPNPEQASGSQAVYVYWENWRYRRGR